MRSTLGAALSVWALSLAVPAIGALSPSIAAAQETAPSPADAPMPYGDLAPPAGAPVSEQVVQVADWVIATRDNSGLPFAIIDKTGAQVIVFGADGQVRGVAPALLGLARGDDSVPGIGEKPLAQIPPEERTTPAGRFLAGFGPSAHEDVFWVDYDTAVSLHPVVTNNPSEQRLQRLSSPAVDDNRITYGCINVPPDFYRQTVLPTFTGTKVVVYVLPEAKPLEMAFANFRPQAGPTRVAGLVVAMPAAAVAAAPEAGAPTAAAATQPTAQPGFVVSGYPYVH